MTRDRRSDSRERPASLAREAAERLEQRCAERGLKMTGQRRTIIRALSQAADHPDAEELHRRALLLDRNISIATVYRTVRLFEDSGILQRRDFGKGRAQYEPTESGSHYHLVETETGKVAEFRDAELERQVRALAARQGFEVVSLRLEVFGRRLQEATPKVQRKPSRKKAEAPR
jgi:Fur family ferric uptake transcriptional regulator